MSWIRYKGGNQLKQLPSNEDLAKEGSLIINQSLCAYVRWALPYLPEEGVQAVVNFLTTGQLISERLFYFLNFPKKKLKNQMNFCPRIQKLVT